MRVLAVDPGKITGMAYWDGSDQDQFKTWVEDSPMRAVDRVKGYIFHGLDVVVVEDFVISGARARDANLTIEMIGAIAWLGYAYATRVVRQSPGAGQTFAGPRWEKLRRVGWYTPGLDHTRSAAGHLLLFLVREGLVDAACVLPSNAVSKEE